jgi:hypothetical protein
VQFISIARSDSLSMLAVKTPRSRAFIPVQWGERFFHLLDPDSHELSFAKPLDMVLERSDDRRRHSWN